MRTPANLDPARTVTGIRARYHCPDLEAVDRHLRRLSNRVRAMAPDSAPKLVAEYRHDIDLLLGRRLYMTTTADDEDECPARGPQ